MKHRFLITLCIALPLSLVIILGAKMGFLHHVEASLPSQIESGRDTLVMGYSQGEDAINDSILTNWCNLCADGDMMAGTYLTLKHFLPNKHIKTVVLPMIDFSSWKNTRINTPFLLFHNERMAMMDRETLADLWRINPGAVVSFYLTNDIYTMLQPVSIGGYEYWISHQVAPSMASMVKIYKSHGIRHYPEGAPEEYWLQTKYFSKVVKLCRDNGISVIVMDFPRYGTKPYYDRSAVYAHYAAMGDSIHVADYQDFAFPDTSYYANTTHLNYKGAAFFSEYLKKHGVK